ncbi:heavy-metal-associated domain-containing protein [Flavobacteriaceae bacterium]|jgi:cation transport ATPase|nr:heavy-metal-associated domain-containing protein [Flavobacteriaceae bacterium]MDG1723886.1 heavy metal-associated domain-containing protein [Flavobacteriaceae bacterium]MDG2290456.1 heavy metal-associated domain-containing protein [Flavobacteriaceae bacterium]
MKIKLLIMLFFATAAVAQTQKENIEVRGNCDLCKKRIEKAALNTKGVKYASWTAETQQLTLIYNAKKTSAKSVAKNIAAVGHEADSIVATEEAYNALPACCMYKSVSAHGG